MEQPKIVINKSETVFNVHYVDEYGKSEMNLTATYAHDAGTLEVMNSEGDSVTNISNNPETLIKLGSALVNIARHALNLKNKKAISVN